MQVQELAVRDSVADAGQCRLIMQYGLLPLLHESNKQG